MIYLIGFMGVGKTTIGRKLAAQHNINFIDTDKEIEIKTNTSIKNIFEKKGESYFRKVETTILKNINTRNIIACGGGLPVYNNNMNFINKSGSSIYLKLSKDEIFIRLKNSLNKRPLIKNKSDMDLQLFIKEELAKRKKFYLMADYTIETSNLSEQEILRKINTLPISL